MEDVGGFPSPFFPFVFTDVADWIGKGEEKMIDLTKKLSIYETNGYLNRKHYLSSLAIEYGISKMEVFEIASLLGASEDFDGLLNSLEDYVSMR